MDNTRRRVRYTNLDPGEYTFEVFASNNDGVWSAEPTELQVKIDTAWWGTWWAIAGYLLIAAGVVSGFSHWQLYRNKLRQKELQILVNEKTNELASATESIQQLNIELERRVESRTKELSVEVEERRTAEAKLLYMAFHDPLTGLHNRPWLLQQLEQSIAQAHQGLGGFALLFLDGDRFKKVNDTYGHLLGDKLLKSVTERLSAILPANCQAVRLGGDEFTVLVSNVTCSSELTDIAAHICSSFEMPFLIDQLQLSFRVSIGMVHCQTQYNKPEEILRDADLAMYKAKEKGRGCFQEFDAQMRKDVLEISVLEEQLHKALDQDQFFLVYQPIIDLDSQRVVSFECLLRWHITGHGYISPERFIPLAEESGLISEIGLWVLGKACEQLASWREAFGEANMPTMAVNLSPIQLNQPDFIECLDEILQKNKIKGENLKLEITETALVENSDVVNQILESLRARSIELAIDDFGTGYSSLSYLDQLPVQVLKIDRSFIDSLLNRAEDREGAQEIVKATISLAHSLNVQVVAEGIEQQEQWDFLLENDCDYGQGYYIAKPMTCDKATDFLEENITNRSLRKRA